MWNCLNPFFFFLDSFMKYNTSFFTNTTTLYLNHYKTLTEDQDNTIKAALLGQLPLYIHSEKGLT